jgi:hypothetical protein
MLMASLIIGLPRTLAAQEGGLPADPAGAPARTQAPGADTAAPAGSSAPAMLEPPHLAPDPAATVLSLEAVGNPESSAPPAWESDAGNADEASAALEGADCCRTFLPNAFRFASPDGPPASPLPRLVNAGFDDEGGWTQTLLSRCDNYQSENPFNLITLTAQLGDFLGGVQGDGIVYPTETTDPNLLWLGGGGGPQCPGIDDRGLAVIHRAVQTVRLPDDYSVRLLFDVLVQSVETACGVDQATIFANGIRLPISFPFCSSATTGQWSERSVDLSAFRGRDVQIEFRMSANESLNSNLWLDNVALCGQDARLPAPDQCSFAGWQEPSTGSAQGGGVSGTPGRSYDPAVAASAVGRAWVAWADNSGAAGRGEILVRHWNGVAFVAAGGSTSAGGISNTPGAESAHPVIAVNRAGVPFVAWHDFASGNNEVYVRQWNGTSWAEVGAGSAGGGGISRNGSNSFRAAITIATNGLPVVAWTDGFGSATEIYARQWNGTAWVEMGAGSAGGGGVSNSAGVSSDAALAAGPGGVVYLTWSDTTAGNAEIYVKKWTGAAWETVGAGSASGGGISNNSGASFAPTIAVGADRQPVVAWVDRSGGDTEIYLKRFTGSTWVALGPSATGGGVSNNGGASLDPSLVIGANNLPLVAWSDQSSANADIYVKRWSGSGWGPFGNSGSATFGGVSNSLGFSGEPVAAMTRDGSVVLAWSDDSTGAGQIYLRRYSQE